MSKNRRQHLWKEQLTIVIEKLTTVLAAHLHLQPVVQLLEQLHCASAEVLLRALSGPHRLLMDADEVDPDFAVGLRDGRWVLDDEVDRPRVVPVEGTLLDVMTGVLIWRVVVESPLQDMRVECDGCRDE